MNVMLIDTGEYRGFGARQVTQPVYVAAIPASKFISHEPRQAPWKWNTTEDGVKNDQTRA